MKINLPKILSAHNIAVASFYVIVITSYVIVINSMLGPSRSLETDKNRLASYRWFFVATGSVAFLGGCCLVMEEPENRTLADKKLEIVAKDVAEIAQRVGALDTALAKQLSAIKPKELTLKEKEQQARHALIARLSDLGVYSSPIDALQGAIRICSDVRLWEHPARAETVHIDTQRFYNEGKIWPKVRDSRIVWSLDPDYDPPDETDEVRQTAFRPFRCCIWCKYVGKNHDCCAVMPFGCTGNPSEQCREFESADGNLPGPELTIDDIPF